MKKTLAIFGAIAISFISSTCFGNSPDSNTYAATSGESDPTVYICTTGKVYHLNRHCKGLANCKSPIRTIKRSQTDRRPCKLCAKKYVTERKSEHNRLYRNAATPTATHSNRPFAYGTYAIKGL